MVNARSAGLVLKVAIIKRFVLVVMVKEAKEVALRSRTTEPWDPTKPRGVVSFRWLAVAGSEDRSCLI